jgi:hypothetical protein
VPRRSSSTVMRRIPEVAALPRPEVYI